MQKRIAALVFLAYSALVVNLLVFKNVPTIRVGHLMFRLGGTNATGAANLVPFKTILSYLRGSEGLLIGGINLVGNIVLLVPVGFLLPLVYSQATWKMSLAAAVAAGLFLEGMQVVFHVGVFDIDDVILNAFGVMIGYWLCVRPVQPTLYK